MKTIPRGLRNNNPGNIRLSKQPWQGEVRPSQDKAFCQFETMAYGYRALMKLLQNYKKLHGCNTIAQMIQRWAPPEDNNHTASYINTVCRRIGIESGRHIDVTDKAIMMSLASAISFVENGVVADMADVEQGWNLL